MNISFEAQKTLKRITDELDLSHLKPKQKSSFINGIEQGFEPLFTQLFPLYGERYDLHFHLRTLFQAFADFSTKRRPAKIKENDPNWFKSNKNVGIAVYVDQIADDLQSLIDKVPYFKELGVNYVHLMPLYLAPEGNSDGGYAISDYRTVAPNLGTNKDLKELAAALHKNGIRMVLDFVFNHTSDEHKWAVEAQNGDQTYQDYYYLMNGHEANEYNQTVREIFPQIRRGSFTYLPKLDQHVWTTFNSFQWDLNYKNPAVFVAVVEEMLHLILNGCDVLRLDALAFVWKEKWTVCENLPKAHNLIKAFKACLDIAAPEVVFKSEAIVHPDEVNKYIGSDECTLSYNPLTMALLWESLATRKTPLLYSSMERSFSIPQDTAWINYIRCHDDIGWLWDDEVSGRIGVDGFDHRLFLNQFYTGKFEGSFAAGVPFQENPTTGDCRVCGTLASLAGVESAVESGNDLLLDHALQRVKLLNGINFSLPGIPLLYQGDDLGVLNDSSYLQDPNKKDDSRWVQRKKLTASDFSAAEDETTPQGKIAKLIRGMIQVRQENLIFAAEDFELIHLNSEHLFGFIRKSGDQRLLTIANFSEHPIFLDGPLSRYLHCEQAKDLLTNQVIHLNDLTVIEPLNVHWLVS
ncbi:amylosucrase [Marinomonas balearica]|uniref:Amylosucrase n=1 Tax=Marinomonas balearica TaxID=491947 RepID=A0A4R6M9I5_9GAMM|nr:amylosucrase [Marinomonas balearica]TDO98074.1 amylosucrase [Marinomonas balearica]